MIFWKWIRGMVTIELLCADASMALCGISEVGIPVLEATVCPEELKVTFTVSKQFETMVVSFAQRKGYQCRVIRQRGLPFLLQHMIKRPVLATGMLFLIILSLYLPTRVFFVEVQGNAIVPTRQILEICENAGIYFGASRRGVRSESVKNILLENIPNLQWVGVNTNGCVATVTVRERSATPDMVMQNGVASVVADCDGIIKSCTATKGNLLCKVGQAVKAGDVLISGYTDCGITIRATRAEGEIFALTQHNINAVLPAVAYEKGEITSVEKKYALLIGKKRINFYKDSGILGVGCDKIYTENYLTLPGGFVLPIAFVTETWYYYDTVVCSVDDPPQKIADFSECYLQSNRIACRILFVEFDILQQNAAYYFQGNFSCLESIGRVRDEEVVMPDGNDY